jgi:hypothetical protein
MIRLFRGLWRIRGAKACRLAGAHHRPRRPPPTRPPLPHRHRPPPCRDPRPAPGPGPVLGPGPLVSRDRLAAEHPGPCPALRSLVIRRPVPQSPWPTAGMPPRAYMTQGRPDRGAVVMPVRVPLGCLCRAMLCAVRRSGIPSSAGTAISPSAARPPPALLPHQTAAAPCSFTRLGGGTRCGAAGAIIRADKRRITVVRT